MTEAEWDACGHPTLMLEHIRHGNTSLLDVRKRRLFACGCCRRVCGLLDGEGMGRVEAAERFADECGQHAVLVGIREASESPAGGSRAAALTACRKVDFAAVRYAADQAVFAVAERFGNTRGAAEKQQQAALLRDIVGNPFRSVVITPSWLAWNDGAIRKLAQAIYDDRAFDRLPLLADALEDAGRTDAAILTHCRQPGEHVRGCWVVDLLLGKA